MLYNFVSDFSLQHNDERKRKKKNQQHLFDVHRKLELIFQSFLSPFLDCLNKDFSLYSISSEKAVYVVTGCRRGVDMQYTQM